jgi:hypothetical protein
MSDLTKSLIESDSDRSEIASPQSRKKRQTLHPTSGSRERN